MAGKHAKAPGQPCTSGVGHIEGRVFTVNERPAMKSCATGLSCRIVGSELA